MKYCIILNDLNKFNKCECREWSSASSRWFLPSCLPTKFLHASPPSPIHATCHAHFILDLFTRTIFADEYRTLSFSLCNLRHSPVTSPLLSTNILLSTLFSKNFSLRFSLIVSDQVSHPYKTIGNTIVLYIFIYISLYSKMEDTSFCTDRQQALPDFSLLLI